MIDCHAHLWDPREGFPWIRPDSPHHRAFTADDLAAAGEGTGVTGTVLVEASRGDAGETAALRELRRQRPDVVAGYVGNLHVHGGAGPGAFAALLRTWGDTRPNGMRLGGAAWADTPPAARALVPVLADTGTALELNLHGGALRAAAEVAARHPALAVVVDHLGNPPNLRENPGNWHRDMEAAARLPNVNVKISGLLTQQHGVPDDRVAALVREVVDTFGPDRCLVGSDWPICLPRGPRSRALALAELGTAHLPARLRQDVLHTTAVRVYGLAGPGR
ncbi:amidohydrolase family protein [Streptomyces sp. NRRL F-5123]|uniref:amidohydrolase family protein n=1 Tax=Streptomyces sp. NRRL F-5123 TaxID=1463856 RepID=UPI0004E1BA9D|nr:amidohydrolase family protein [Streptomyces sp. NRRL F-5123]